MTQNVFFYKPYNPDALEEYRKLEIGSEWSLSLNALGGIVSVEPAE
jgi:hypothetical protein